MPRTASPQGKQMRERMLAREWGAWVTVIRGPSWGASAPDPKSVVCVWFLERQLTPTPVIKRSLSPSAEVASIAVNPCFGLARLERPYMQGCEGDRAVDASSRLAWSEVSFNAPALALTPRKHSALPKAKQARSGLA